MTIKVFLADDHAVLRDGIKVLLDAQPDIEVVGDAADGHEALQKIEQLQPHVAILDIAMPRMTGLEVAQRLGQTCPAVRIIILSMHKTPNHIQQALQAGVRSYVLKESAGSEVIDTVRLTHAGNSAPPASMGDTHCATDWVVEHDRGTVSESHHQREFHRIRDKTVCRLLHLPDIGRIDSSDTRSMDLYRAHRLVPVNTDGRVETAPVLRHV